MNVFHHDTDTVKINAEEISQFQEHKRAEIYKKLDSKWKMTIKEQIENELNRRVREALDTPPLERLKKHQQEAVLKKSNEDNLKKNLNSHITFERRDRPKFYSKSLSSVNCEDKIENKCEKKFNDSINETFYDGYNKFEYWLKPTLELQQPTSVGVLLKLNDNDLNSKDPKILRTGFEAAQNLGSLSLREKELFFSTFTKEGFKEAIRTGKLPDGSKLEALANGEYRDKFGIIRSRDGPFWPKNAGPLHPAPHHKRFYSSDEPLFDQQKNRENSHQFQTHVTYTAIWKQMQIIYDSEISPRHQTPLRNGENICPSLIFESRFETGNLRQARRTGQFEYELILNNDLYTKRHTQWFYFRIQNMQKDISYKFIIINLMKPTSLYEQGMKMLIYSEKNASINNVGWFRTGHHIRYSRNITRLQCPLLNREIAYFQLEFEIEFPHGDDTCFISHCYPYTFTDLKNDLRTYQVSFETTSVIQKDILCESNLGNSCFLLTITDKSIPDTEKLGAVITARVHPGETNSSWMIKGLVQYLISDCDTARNLRKRVIFKIIPMLNPDGVIIGNYRCSIVGKDLNRNYRYPREERFPTIYHTKMLIEDLKRTCATVALYCDLHGHSRKHNVFMYGCDSQYLNSDNLDDIKPVLNINTIENYINDRIFPFLMEKNGPEFFSFVGCNFKIHKCKESTGRVVMWKQYHISDSYTLEATFSGTNLNSSPRHFNMNDLENIGKIFSISLSAYLNIKEDKEQEKKVRLELLKSVLKQLITGSKLNIRLFKTLLHSSDDKNKQSNDAESISANSKSKSADVENEFNENIENFINNMKLEDIDCLKKIDFEVVNMEENSSSSDSDSESQPEELIEENSKISVKVKKKKKKIKMQTKDISSKKTALKKSNSKILPLIKNNENISIIPETTTSEKISNLKFSTKMSSMRHWPIFLSKYEGRTNGGIPCFTEERVLERARRKSLSSIKKNLEESLFQYPSDYTFENFNSYPLKEKKVESSIKSSENTAEQNYKFQELSDEMLNYRLYKDKITEKFSEYQEERFLQKPVFKMKQIRKLPNSCSKKYLFIRDENNNICSSLTSNESETFFMKRFI